MLLASRFDADEIEREKGVIVEEINMYLDTPRDLIGQVHDELRFGDTPLGPADHRLQGDGPRGLAARRSWTTSAPGTGRSGS